MRNRRRSAILAGVVGTLAAWLLVAVAPAEAAGSHSWPDSVEVDGYDFHTLTRADVVAGTPGNLVVRYTAHRAIDDGVLRILVPRRSWPTDLHPVDAFYESTPAGGVSVRPGTSAQGDPLPEATMPSAAMCDPAGPGTWEVADLPRAQLITVHDVECSAGQQLFVRIEGIQAPTRPGTYRLPMLVTTRGHLPRPSLATVRVVPPPTTRLVVTVPSHAEPAVPFAVRVTAIRPDGRPATGYRGAIAITDPHDCTLRPSGRGVAHQFTAADRGSAVLTVQLDVSAVHQLRVYDIARRALDGVSAPFEVSGTPPDGIICPVSYH